MESLELELADFAQHSLSAEHFLTLVRQINAAVKRLTAGVCPAVTGQHLGGAGKPADSTALSGKAVDGPE